MDTLAWGFGPTSEAADTIINSFFVKIRDFNLGSSLLHTLDKKI
jgi:hypothetical protein